MTLVNADIPAPMTARARCWTDVGTIMLAVAAACATQVGPGSPLRAIVVLAALLVLPGWSLVSLLRSGPPAAMFGLALGLSLGIDVLVSLALVWAGLFAQAPTVLGILGAGAVVLLIRDAVRQARLAGLDILAPRGTG